MKAWFVAVAILFVATSGLAGDKVVWDGEKVGKNKNWANGGTIEIADGEAKINLTEAEWCGAGVNWEGYWPEDAGVDLDKYKYVHIWLKVKGRGDVQLMFEDNKHTKSAAVNITEFTKKNKLPEKMTKVVIPTEKLKGEGSKLASGVVWEFIICAWSKDKKDITVTVDKLAFSDSKK
ncbi:MAG: hypothetical protein JXR97_00930 [Planctomycetes bacterium]|nr:hypothetical protein [Planctomycetota bacterium]